MSTRTKHPTNHVPQQATSPDAIRPVRRHRLRKAAYAIPAVLVAGAPTAAAANAPVPPPGTGEAPVPGPSPTEPPTPSVGEVLGDIVGGVGGVFAEHPLAAFGLAAAGGGALYIRQRRVERHSGEGFATRRELRRAMSRRAVVKQRKVLRPSLADTPGRQVPTTAVGVVLGRCRSTRATVVSPIEDSTLTVAPMGSGKTSLISGFLIDAPGPAIATSSKFDIVTHTEALRRRMGVIWVFNPQGLAGRPQNVFWDPVIGCKDPEVALRRALYLLEGADSTKGVENRDFWELQSYRILKSFLWAADMAGLSLIDVARWAKKPFDTPAVEIYKQHEDVAPVGWVDDLTQAQEVRGKGTTTENVFTTLAGTFSFLASPRVAECIQLAHQVQFGFDVERFIASQDTLYLLGRDVAHAGIGPLFTTLVGEIYEAARMRASLMPGGRLDPPLSCVLDEAALICPVPLQRWTADSRGVGIAVHSAVQSLGQVVDRWGVNAADVIWDNNTALVLGGLKTIDHLKKISELCGVKKVRQETVSNSPGPNGGESRSYTYRDEPVLRPDEIKDLPPGEILVLRKHVKPVITRFTAVWNRPDVKKAGGTAAAAKQETAFDTVADLGPVAAPVPPAAPVAVPPLPAPMPVVPAPRALDTHDEILDRGWWAGRNSDDAEPEPAADPAVPADSGTPTPRWLRAVPPPPAETEPVVAGVSPAPAPPRPSVPPTAHLTAPAPADEPPAEAPAAEEPPKPKKYDLGAF